MKTWEFLKSYRSRKSPKSSRPSRMRLHAPSPGATGWSFTLRMDISAASFFRRSRIDVMTNMAGRSKFVLDVIAAVRGAIPESTPLFARISATEYVEGGWDLEQSVQFSKWMKDTGVDLVDCSSGGNSPDQVMPLSPGYQVPFAAEIRERAGMLTGAVGLITEAEQAEAILAAGEAGAIFFERELLRNPYWPRYAQAQLDGKAAWPDQYIRSAFEGTYVGPR